MGWFGFWIFMTVALLVDAYLYTRGHDGRFFEHQTEAEKELQQIAIEKAKRTERGC